MDEESKKSDVEPVSEGMSSSGLKDFPTTRRPGGLPSPQQSGQKEASKNNERVWAMDPPVAPIQDVSARKDMQPKEQVKEVEEWNKVVVELQGSKYKYTYMMTVHRTDGTGKILIETRDECFKGFSTMDIVGLLSNFLQGIKAQRKTQEKRIVIPTAGMPQGVRQK